MTRENPKKTDYSKYIMYAIMGGILFYFFLDIGFKLAIVFGKLVIKYYWASILIVLIILFFRRKRKK